MADGWLSSLLGYHRIKNAVDTLFAQRSTLKFLGATITDDPTNKQTIVDITAGVTGNITVRKNSGANVGTRGRLNLIEGTGVGLTVADDAGGGEVDITVTSSQTLQQAYTNGGTVDANVSSGTNNLLVRAASAVTDILLRFRRNATGSDAEQTLLKAPDAVTVGVDGTRLILEPGAGINGSGATNGTDAGDIQLRGKTGGTTGTGTAGKGSGFTFVGGAGANATGAAGVPGASKAIDLSTGPGGNSNDAAVFGAASGDIILDVGDGGTSPGGELFGGTPGKIKLGITKSSGVDLTRLGVPVGIAGVKVYSGAVTPIGNVTGNPGDIYLRVSGTNSTIYVHRGSGASNSGWKQLTDVGGFTLTGPVLESEVLVAFSGTPSFDVAQNSLHALAPMTANIAMTLSNPAVGLKGRIELLQDGTGNRRITGITVSGFTVLVKNMADTGLLNTAAMKAANARSTLHYEMVLINSVQICHVRMETGLTPDFT